MDEAVVHIVDDDPQLRQAIARLLHSYDYEVQIYECALDFLNRAPEAGVGCVVLDLSNVMRKLNVDFVAELVKLVQRLRDAGQIGPSEVESY